MNKVICGFGKSEYFFKEGWTANSPTSLSGKSVGLFEAALPEGLTANADGGIVVAAPDLICSVVETAKTFLECRAIADYADAR